MSPFEPMNKALLRLAESAVVRRAFLRSGKALDALRQLWTAFLRTETAAWGVGRLQFIEAKGELWADWITDAVIASRERSWPGWAGSIALHLLMLITLIVLSLLRPALPRQSSALVPVDLVQVSDETNVAAEARRAARIAHFSQTSPIVLKTLNVQMLPLPQINSAEETTPSETADAQKLDGTTPTPATKALDIDRPQREDASSLMMPKNVTHVLPTPAAPVDARPAQRLVQAQGPSNASTASLMAILHSQIVACWSPPAAAPRPDQYAVDFVLRLNPNGTIAQPPQFADAVVRAAPHDPAVRAAADAARRALYACAPYKLPGDLYAEWREINPFHFDPGASVRADAAP